MTVETSTPRIAHGAPAPRVRSWIRAAVAPVTQARTWCSACYLVVATPLSVVWLLLVSAGLLIGTVTAVIVVGIPVLIATFALVRAGADLDRRIVNRLLDAHVPSATPTSGPRRVPERLRELVLGSRTWRSLGWLLFRGVAGVLVLAGMIIAIVVLVALLAVPFSDGYLQWGDQGRSTSGWSSAWTIPVGLIGLLGCLHLIPLIGDLHVRVANVLLSPDATEERDLLRADAARTGARAELARDLHDSIGHSLTLVAVQAEAARVVLTDDPRAASLAMTRIAETARAALVDLDASLATLRDDTGARRPVGSLTELSQLLDGAQRAGLTVDLQVSGDLTDVPTPISAVGFRVVQEACTNVLRHAGETPTVVRISTTGTDLQIEVRNRAVAQPVLALGRIPHGSRHVEGHGLTGLRERVRLAGGHLRAGPTPDGEHWEVEATLPFARDRSHEPAT